MFVLVFTFLCICSSASSYQDDPYVQISEMIIKNALSSSNISKLEYLCDTFGPRLCGMQSLEQAIDWMLETMQQEVKATIFTIQYISFFVFLSKAIWKCSWWIGTKHNPLGQRKRIFTIVITKSCKVRTTKFFTSLHSSLFSNLSLGLLGLGGFDSKT